MKTIKWFYLFASAIVLLSGCAIIKPGEIALDQHYGKLKQKALMPGVHWYNPFGTRVVRFNGRIVEHSAQMKFPTSEGIEVTAEITLLYHLIPDSLRSMYLRFGRGYESVIINNLINSIRQAGLKYKATELIIERTNLENSIKENLSTAIGQYGFAADLILMKDIDLPPDVVATIQSKVNTEQLSEKTKIDLQIKKQELDYSIEKQKREAELEVDKQRIALNFIVEKQQKETERLLIESEGIKKSQDIINSSITENLLKFKALDITKQLVVSPNAKIIITDGKSPVILSDK
jgi:regulator of protease activity HflC (stomatin/prohibitin superfamily)